MKVAWIQQLRILIFSGILFLLSATGLLAQELPYGIGNWASEEMGNHRAVIQVNKPSDAVKIDFLWRRHDLSPEKRRMVIICAETGKEVSNVYRLRIDNERCELVFGPAEKAGTYYFYYLPYSPVTNAYDSGDYLPPEEKPDEDWEKRHRLSGEKSAWKGVKNALVTEIQARTEFHSFSPMEVPATKAEVSAFLRKHTGEYLVFPESREFPVRMPDALPLRWIQKETGAVFSGAAQKNEYFAFQIAVFASTKKIENIRLGFSDLKTKTGQTIPASFFTCFNTDGVDTWGKPFTQKVDVGQGRVQSFWVGADILADAKGDLLQIISKK